MLPVFQVYVNEQCVTFSENEKGAKDCFNDMVNDAKDENKTAFGYTIVLLEDGEEIDSYQPEKVYNEEIEGYDSLGIDCFSTLSEEECY